MMLEDTINPYHSVSINPSDGQLLVAGNELSGASLYDLRNWKRCVCVCVCVCVRERERERFVTGGF